MENGKSIDDYMREIDELDAAGELDDDEPFQGHTLDLTKWKTYLHIKSALEGLLTTSRYTKSVQGHSKPYPADQDAAIIVTISKLTMFTEKETAVLADAMGKSDRFAITTFEDRTFLNFIFMNIWID